MKVIISRDERYPVYSVRQADAFNPSENVRVIDEATYNRWRQAEDLYEAMQEEMRCVSAGMKLDESRPRKEVRVRY